MKLKNRILTVVSGMLLALAGGALAILIVRKCWIPAAAFAGEEIGEILRQLETVALRLQPAVVPAFAAVIVLTLFALKNHRVLRGLCAALLTLLCAAAAFLTMEVNGIPMRLALEILADALRAGLF